MIAVSGVVVCWSMVSEIHIAYGWLVSRHGSARLCLRYQRRSCCVAACWGIGVLFRGKNNMDMFASYRGAGLSNFELSKGKSCSVSTIKLFFIPAC